MRLLPTICLLVLAPTTAAQGWHGSWHGGHHRGHCGPGSYGYAPQYGIVPYYAPGGFSPATLQYAYASKEARSYLLWASRTAQMSQRPNLRVYRQQVTVGARQGTVTGDAAVPGSVWVAGVGSLERAAKAAKADGAQAATPRLASAETPAAPTVRRIDAANAKRLRREYLARQEAKSSSKPEVQSPRPVAPQQKTMPQLAGQRARSRR